MVKMTFYSTNFGSEVTATKVLNFFMAKWKDGGLNKRNRIVLNANSSRQDVRDDPA